MVRNYLERVCVTGLTFHYTPEGRPVGDCAMQRFVYVTTRGGYVDDSDPVLIDHASSYLNSLCRLLSSGRFDTLAAQGLDIVGNDPETLLAQAEAEADRMAAAFWN